MSKPPNPSAEALTLITGATGYLGRKLALKHLASTDDRLLLWIHAANAAEAEAKTAALLEKLSLDAGPATRDRVEFAWGDLRQETPFGTVDAGRVTRILHSAAMTAFNIKAEDADQVNLGGTRKLLQFARGCPRLEAFDQISTVYASGTRADAIEERFYDRGLGFANHYERSKWESEHLIETEYSALPWRIHRVATVLSDNDQGTVIQQNAVHNTLKLFYYGLISLLPGNPQTPVYLLTGDFATEAIFHVSRSGPPRGITHVCHSREESITLGQIIDLSYTTFCEDPAFKTRRILKPLFTDSSSFDALVKSATAFGGSVLTQAVSSISPFGPQLFIAKDIRNERLRSAYPGYRAPDPAELLRLTCRRLVETQFGRTSKAGGKS